MNNDEFDKWYFGNTKGTYYKYSKEILEDEEQLKNIRKSHEYESMRTAWNAGFEFGSKNDNKLDLEKAISHK
jgi:hypothetical protein